ncbi:terminase large subunit domain-containing protein [Flagellimonas flava]|uniref:terminase large subunit domain-containing protein n=1 Tax=Flagellimonas flava TaxID=570519 RepID=UPI003D65C6BE
MEEQVNVIKPQEGYQMSALSSSADIVIGGGAAGAGKTFSLLLEPIRHIHNKDFGAVFFRRTSPQIRAEGGLWDASNNLYGLIDGSRAKESILEWHFREGSKIKFSHLQHEKDIYDWQGAEIPLICFDELTHFSKKMFFYLLSRNRSTCGVKPYVRATCNPDPDSWVSELIDWWINDDGFPIPERQGTLRYFVRDGESFIWGDTKQECIDKAWYFLKPMVERSDIPAETYVKSMTFIGGSIYDNKELLEANPEYLGNLAAQDEDTRLQLLDGNWKVAINPMDVYDYNVFKDYFTNDWVSPGEKCITVDVALEGSDKLIINYFSGNRWEDVKVVDKSSGKDVVDETKEMQRRHGVGNSAVIYDASGVGGFIGGANNAFIPGSVAFFNNGKQKKTKDKREFKNLKSQCYIVDGEDKEQYISPKVANTMYDDKMTVRQRLMHERKAIKKKPKRDEEALALIPKDEMKEKYLSGSSPDLLDSFMMKRIRDIKKEDYFIVM